MPYDDQAGPGPKAEETRDLPRADSPTRERERTEERLPAERREPPPPPQPQQPARRRRVVLPLLILAAILLVGLGTWYWWSTRNEESTDDAYTDGNAVTVAPRVSGQVVERDITDNQHVLPGQVLIKIDPAPFIAARDQALGQVEEAQGRVAGAEAGVELAKQVFPARLTAAEAQKQAAEAVLFRANTDLHRQQSLPRRATTQQDIDQAIAAQRQALAQVAQADAAIKEAQPVPPNIRQAEASLKQLQGILAQAKAQLATAQLNLDWTTVRAPQEGWVTKRNVDVGNYVSAGASIMSLVTKEVWITANFKETQLDRMRAGDKVTISVDAYPGLNLRGVVNSIQMGSGSKFTAFPPENATGNFVKIVQRVPVKITITSGMDPNLPLPLGLSVEPTVTVR